MKTVTELVLLDPERVRISRDDFGDLRLDMGDRTFEKIKPVRTHPLTQPERFIAFLDACGQDIGIVEAAAALDPDSRRVLAEELKLCYFSARVRRIHSEEARYGVTTWDLETDRGRRTAYIRDRGDIRPLPGGRVILTDTHGVRFDIPEINALDQKSFRLLEEQI